MRFPHFSKRKISAISNGVFFILLGILFYTEAWWPGILIAIGTFFALRQFLGGRKVDFYITISILALIILVSFSGFSFSVLLSIFFILCGIYMIGREYFFYDTHRYEIEEDDEFK